MSAPAPIQEVNQIGAAGTTLTATIAPLTAGSTLLVYYASSAVANGIINSIAVTGGTATKIVSSRVNRNVEIWKVVGATAGVTSVVVTASVSGQNINYIRVQEWSGAVSVSAITSAINGNNTTPTTTAVTPAAGAPVVICTAIRMGGIYSSGPTNGFGNIANPLWDAAAGTPRDLESHLTIASPDGVTSYSTGYVVGTGNWEAVACILVGAGIPSGIITTQPTAKVVTAAAMTSVVFKKTTDGSTIDTSFTGNVTATIQTGSGAISGTQVVAAVAGVATFNNLIITGAGNHSLHLTDGIVSVNTNVFLVGTDGVFVSTSVILDNLLSQNTSDTVTLVAGVGNASATQDQQPIIVSGTTVAAGDAWMIIGGVYYAINFWDGGSGFHLTAGPTVTAQPFSLKIRRRFWLFIPGTLSGEVAPFKTLLYLHGSGGKGSDNVAQMAVLVEVPGKVGYPVSGTPNTDTTDPWFGTKNWPALTMFPQVALGGPGTGERVALYDAVRAYVAANYSIDTTRQYIAGASDGGYAALAYGSEKATQFAGVLCMAAVTNDFYFRKFAASYTGGTSQANSRAFWTTRFAAANTWVRQWVGSIDASWKAVTTDLTASFTNDQTALYAEYAARSLTTGNKDTSRAYASQDEASFGGTPWDHVPTYTQVTAAQSVWTNLFATILVPTVTANADTTFLLRRRRR